MKKILLVLFFSLLTMNVSYAKTLTLNCSFEKYVDQSFLEEKENSLDKYSLDRRTGSLLLNYKSSKEKLRIYYFCVKKEKLF